MVCVLDKTEVSVRTIKHSKAVWGCGHQGLTGGIQLVAVITKGDLKPDWPARLL